MWEPAGGNVEIGELVTDAMIREVYEETNMKVIQHAPSSIFISVYTAAILYSGFFTQILQFLIKQKA